MESTTTTLKPPRATRSSLACLPCRSRHLKCDGGRPTCERCADARQPCSYAQSRRGGLDRAALAERRKRRAAEPPDTGRWDGMRLSQESAVDNDLLVDAYYQYFHPCHPFVLPRTHLVRLCRDPQAGFTPLIAALRLMGSLYTTRQWSTPLQQRLETCVAQASPREPILVPARLLYSIALFWHDYKTDAQSQMEAATRLALDLEMYRCEFAATQAGSDAVVRECWRRTWWMLYIIDAYYTGTLGTLNFRVVDIAATVELPCDEADYESGNIPPTPQTLHDFNCREFAADSPTFSSFAYLVGAVQCAASAIAATPTTPAAADSLQVMQAADSRIDGWRLLLPADRNAVMSATGEIDELMFQAHLLIHVATIGLHRPLSALKFNAVEDVSSCAREPPLDTPVPDLIHVHTVRVLRAVEAQIRLLALPMRRFHHTPFVTCMTSEGTLALLSACSAVLHGDALTTARHQIRMTLGCLKVLAEVWPRTARNVREIQTIAQHVLGLGQGSGLGPRVDQGGEGSSSDGPSFGEDLASVLGPIDDLCGWYGLGELNGVSYPDL